MSARYDVVFYMPWIGPLLAPGDDPPPGGAETQVLLLAHGLAARGHRVGLVATRGSSPLPASARGVDVIEQPPGWRRGPARRLAYACMLARTLLGLHSMVVVQRAAGWTTGAVAVLAKLKGARFVYSSANVIDFDFERLEPRRLQRALFHLGIRLADSILVQSLEQEVLCRERFGRPAVVVRSIAESVPARTATPEAFLWVGRMAAYKRPLDFVALARSLPQARFQMVAVAADPLGEALLQTVREEAADLENLDVLPARPREELAELIERAVAMVNTADYEGMPNIFLESWARGVPALALRHDPDGVIERSGLGAFAGADSRRFTAQARELWDGRHDQHDLAERCRRHVEAEHSSEAVLDGWTGALGLPSVGPPPVRLPVAG